MFVREFALRNFRSWQQVDLQLDPGPTIFTGRNGFGKTNLIEALYYLSTLRSHRVSSDGPLVHAGQDHALVTATIENEGRELTAQLRVNAEGANKATLNTAPCRKARDLLGVLRSVLFAPEDLMLVRGEPTDRRRMIDELVAQRGPRWAAARADYDRVLRQRSALLKTAGAALRRGGSDADSVISTLDVWDSQLSDLGAQVTAGRISVLRQLEPHFAAAYASIAPHSRPATLAYRSSLGQAVLEIPAEETDDLVHPGSTPDPEQIAALMAERLADMRAKEIDRGMCLVGPHRDDIDLILGDDIAKGFASHGESWSLALAVRLGTVELMRADGTEPVIMLDDVFAELDVARRARLAEFTQSAEQLLITAAVADDIPEGIGGRRIFVDVVEQPRRHSVVAADTGQRVLHEQSGGGDGGE